MEARAIWQHRMTFTGEANSGFQLKIGTDPSVGGDNDGARPMELVAIGLASCTAMDVISLLKKKRQDVTAFEVQVQADQSSEYPRVFTQAVIKYHVTGHTLKEADVVRAIELSATRYCPVQAMLAKVFPIQQKYLIYEDQGGGQKILVKSGDYVPVGDVDGK